MTNEKIIDLIKSADDYIKKYNYDVITGARQNPNMAVRSAEEAAAQKIFWACYGLLTDIEQAALSYKETLKNL